MVGDLRVGDARALHHRLDALPLLASEHGHEVAHIREERLRVAVSTAREDVGAHLRVATRRGCDTRCELRCRHATTQAHRVAGARGVSLEKRVVALVERTQLRGARAAFGRRGVDLRLGGFDVRKRHLLTARRVDEVLE
jgi:hypothetical protein